MGFKSAIIVDDSKLARVTLRKKLGKHGVNADLAESAEQAFDMLKSGTYDIVFMDHLMPGIDGFEATQQIRKTPEGRNLPIIMCTGKEHDGYLEEAQAIGANYTLTKPPTEESLSMILSMEFEPPQGLDDDGVSLAEISAELDGLEALADEALDISLPEVDESQASEPEPLPEVEEPVELKLADDLLEESQAESLLEQSADEFDLSMEVDGLETIEAVEPAPVAAEPEPVPEPKIATPVSPQPVAASSALDMDAVKQGIQVEIQQQLSVVRADIGDEIRKVQAAQPSSPALDTSEVESIVNRLLQQAAPQMTEKVAEGVQAEIDKKITAALEQVQPQMSTEDISTLVKSRVNVQLDQKIQHLDKAVAELKEQQQLAQAAMEGLINEAIETAAVPQLDPVAPADTGANTQFTQELEMLAVEQEAMAKSIAMPKTLAGVALVVALAAAALAAMPFVAG